MRQVRKSLRRTRVAERTDHVDRIAIEATKLLGNPELMRKGNPHMNLRIRAKEVAESSAQKERIGHPRRATQAAGASPRCRTHLTEAPRVRT